MKLILQIVAAILIAVALLTNPALGIGIIVIVVPIWLLIAFAGLFFGPTNLVPKASEQLLNDAIVSGRTVTVPILIRGRIENRPLRIIAFDARQIIAIDQETKAKVEHSWHKIDPDEFVAALTS